MTVEDVRHLGTGLPAVATFGRSEAEATRFLLPYQFAISSLTARLCILKQEFARLDRHCPVGHASSRVKSLDRIVAKATRLRCPLTVEHIRHTIRDVAGVWVTSAAISDTYRVANLLSWQSDVAVIDAEDYIGSPKPNGYRSLHITAGIPIFHRDSIERVPVELQIRTIAIDAWASVEHENFYGNRRTTPRRLIDEMTAAADAVHRLDVTMERLHDEVGRLRGWDDDDAALNLRPMTTITGVSPSFAGQFR